jgi:hypothetical protein
MKIFRFRTQWRFPDLTWPVAIVLYSVFIGFLMTASGITNWDDPARIWHSNWLLGEFGLRPAIALPSNYSYAPLWELILGIFNQFVFRWMQDAYWVRHALTFALLPMGLSLLYVQCRREGLSKWGTIVCLAGIGGYIRLIGHATMNVKDFPAAIVYLVCAVSVWRILLGIIHHHFSMRRLVALGMVSALPFLVRSPLITLLPLSLGFLALHILQKRREYTMLQALAMMGVPVISAGLLIAVLSPALWLQGIEGAKAIGDATVRFADYPWPYTVRVFGLQYVAKDIPRWYPLLWIPVGIHPPAFFAFVAGIALIMRKRRLPHLRSIQFGAGKLGLSLSLLDWLALVTAFTWFAVMAVRPTLYDEDRHILFMLLPLYTVGFLGMELTSLRVKQAVAAVCILWTLGSLWRWGIYAYIYRSPLLAGYGSNDFMNDYWDVCSTHAALQLLQEERNPLPVDYQHGASLTALNNTLDRHAKGFFTRSGEVIPRKRKKPSGTEPYWYILGIRSTELMKNPADLRARQISTVWKESLPTGETACALYYITPR